MTTAPIPTAELERIIELGKRATKGPWHHCQPFQKLPKTRTVHGLVPAQRVDYVSTWPGQGTPDGHRTVIPMERREVTASSDDMAFIAAARRADALAAELIAARGVLQRYVDACLRQNINLGGITGDAIALLPSAAQSSWTAFEGPSSEPVEDAGDDAWATYSRER